MPAAFSHAHRGCARGIAADRFGRGGVGMAAGQGDAGAEGLRRGPRALPVGQNPRARGCPPRRRSTASKAGSADVRLLALEDHLRFVIMHWLMHGAWRPSGLCDVAAMVEALPADFDWPLCLGDDQFVAGWVCATIMLAHRLLGCRL